MPSIIKYYVKTIDFISLKTGRATMYLVFVMMFILILSFVTRNIINIPVAECAIKTTKNIYSKLKDKTKALLDSLTSVFLIFYLVVLLIGSISSLTYTLETNQRLFTAWAPYVWPIKSIMTFGILLMLLQSIAIFFKDIAKVLNREI